MILLGSPDRGPYTPVAVWPDAKLSMHHLTGAAERSLKERRGLLFEKNPDPASPEHFPENFHVAYPIEVDGKIHGTVVLGVDETDRKTVQTIMRQLHWGAAWLDVLIRRTVAYTSETVNQRLQIKPVEQLQEDPGRLHESRVEEGHVERCGHRRRILGRLALWPKARQCGGACGPWPDTGGGGLARDDRWDRAANR